jgi:hypothetical protein
MAYHSARPTKAPRRFPAAPLRDDPTRATIASIAMRAAASAGTSSNTRHRTRTPLQALARGPACARRTHLQHPGAHPIR